MDPIVTVRFLVRTLQALVDNGVEPSEIGASAPAAEEAPAAEAAPAVEEAPAQEAPVEEAPAAEEKTEE